MPIEILCTAIYESIIEEGEYSLCFLMGITAIQILKKPKKNDFRVQAEHGGIFTSVKPSERMLLRAKILSAKLILLRFMAELILSVRMMMICTYGA